MKWIGNRRLALAAVGAAHVVWMGLAFGPLGAQTVISADGMIESTSGGFKFPDGSVQGSAAVAGSAPVEDTGVDATQCFDEDGNSRSCTGTGEDGELQRGVTWPTPRFSDKLDGTVRDNLTRLIWLQDANCPSATKIWQAALDWVDDLNTMSIACTNYTAMTYSDWRLPNIKELLSLVDYGELNPALPLWHPFMDVQSSFYWSSSSVVETPRGQLGS
ncbi:MAG: DUF1566 domain-containing protein [Acidobacteria bacterium]|nr:DUF1566 domain-containing protein [Acidobacteriota bacterium]